MASISKQSDTAEEESFIILGTSPGTSLDLKCDGINGSLDRVALDDAMKDLSNEASMAFKAHFQLGDGPSPASLMVASTIITDDRSTEELQKRFGEILDENVILKETLTKNNESMKEQFLLIASCQEDLMKTHMVHKEKFDETKELVEKLRQENKKLKLDVVRLAESEPQSRSGPSAEQSIASSGPLSALEFVTSPDDDTIDKLTSQLELVEKQRRQVIVDNEKLTWQKESLEHIVDATSKERDDLKEKVKNLELQISTVTNEFTQKINVLNETIKELRNKLEIERKTVRTVNTQEADARIENIERANAAKVSALQSDLKQAQLKILEFENIKLEFSKYKSGMSDTVKLYKDQIQELQSKLKEAQTTMFQPVRFSISTESESSGEYSAFIANVKLYDTTLKHVAELLNQVSHGSVDGLVQCLGVIASLLDFKLERSNAERVRDSLTELKTQLDRQHSAALSNIGQVRGTMSIFEGIFKDYNQILKKELNRQETKPPPASNVEQLAAALVARGQEIQSLHGELQALKNDKEDRELLKAQLDLYKSDFDAERAAREQMASEKEVLLTDLRAALRQKTDLEQQLEQIRSNSKTTKTPGPSSVPSGAQRPTSGGPQRPTTGGPQRPTATRPAAEGSQVPGTRRQSTPGSATGNMVYTCPKCSRFSSDQYKAMEDHFDFCLDDF